MKDIDFAVYWIKTTFSNDFNKIIYKENSKLKNKEKEKTSKNIACELKNSISL